MFISNKCVSRLGLWDHRRSVCVPVPQQQSVCEAIWWRAGCQNKPHSHERWFWKLPIVFSLGGWSHPCVLGALHSIIDVAGVIRWEPFAAQGMKSNGPGGKTNGWKDIQCRHLLSFKQRRSTRRGIRLHWESRRHLSRIFSPKLTNFIFCNTTVHLKQWPAIMVDTWGSAAFKRLTYKRI